MFKAEVSSFSKKSVEDAEEERVKCWGRERGVSYAQSHVKRGIPKTCQI